MTKKTRKNRARRRNPGADVLPDIGAVTEKLLNGIKEWIFPDARPEPKGLKILNRYDQL